MKPFDPRMRAIQVLSLAALALDSSPLDLRPTPGDRYLKPADPIPKQAKPVLDHTVPRNAKGKRPKLRGK